jgi:carbamoyltransferase
MSAVLGISGAYHDAAAALVIDGVVIAAVQQERLSRIKNDPSLPIDAALAVLGFAGLSPAALDAVVFYENPFAKLERVLVGLLRHAPASWRAFPRAMASQLGSKLWVLDALADGIGVERARVRFEDHHRCHAASAFFPSGFDDAAVLVLDGVGEHSSTSIWHGHGDALAPIEQVEFPHSLGLLYAGLTAYLGFAVNEGEYKVMGLAAWGEPRLGEAFEHIVRLHDDGSFELVLECFANMTDAELGFGPALERVLGPRRPPDRRWDFDDASDRHYADVAATLQAVLERAIVALARRAARATGARRLCLAGGVALNALSNARVADSGLFERVFVQPAAGDAGGALGAAILGALAHGDPRPQPMRDAALGLPIDAARAHEVATALGLVVTRVDDPIAELATRLARGEIVAHAHGRFEWGPRALGQRSIFADPRRAETRERLNRVIKQREPFRPFAPAVRAEDASTWFAGDADDMTPFMTRTLAVRDDCRAGLAAVTHRDGTARVQTVTEAAAPRLHALLGAVAAHTDVPIVLNTSLNGPGDPIAGSAEDVLAFGLRHQVDAILLDDVLVTRRPA